MQGTLRARVGALFVLSGLVLLGVTSMRAPANAATNTLAGWTQQGAPAGGNWQVAGNGMSVAQLDNGAPTFFVSPNNYASANFTVTITPQTTGDDDYVGLVVGYNKPINDATCGNADCPVDTLLLDWKKANQGGGADEGINLMRVNGTLNVRDPVNNVPCFWTHAATQQCQILATAEGAGTGWVFDQPNTLKVSYASNHIKVEKVTGNTATTLIDMDCSCQQGRVGFYNYSQAQVTYAIADLPNDPSATTTTTAVSTTSSSTTSTTLAPTTTTIRPTTTTGLVRTGQDASTTSLQLLGGIGLVAFGALMVGARGRRPKGRFYS